MNPDMLKKHLAGAEGRIDEGRNHVADIRSSRRIGSSMLLSCDDFSAITHCRGV
jgi:hypothetical protein